jgi:hypothetical protein
MGNRGILHNARREIVRDWQVRRWIACRLEFRGRRRHVMTPGSYTELFFLDEAVALADGHRPCAECRRADYRAFQAAWAKVHPGASTSADVIDGVLQSERRIRAGVKRTYIAAIETLPDGTFVVDRGRAWLMLGDCMFAWSAGGYAETHRRPSAGEVTVLTPRSIVGVLRVGYHTGVHPSVHI